MIANQHCLLRAHQRIFVPVKDLISSFTWTALLDGRASLEPVVQRLLTTSSLVYGGGFLMSVYLLSYAQTEDHSLFLKNFKIFVAVGRFATSYLRHTTPRVTAMPKRESRP